MINGKMVLFSFAWNFSKTERCQGGGDDPAALSVIAPYSAPAGHALTVWIVGTGIERELLSVERCAILGAKAQRNKWMHLFLYGFSGKETGGNIYVGLERKH